MIAVIDGQTGLEELAVIVSTVLESAGITATLSGGAAVTLCSNNTYQSADPDFVTTEGKKRLQAAVASLGFVSTAGSRMFEHPDTDWLVEFPSGPLGFGDLWIDAASLPVLDTDHGQLRIITPTPSVMDRLAAYWYHQDRQCRDQAIEIVKGQPIDWRQIREWTAGERRNESDIDRLEQPVRTRSAPPRTCRAGPPVRSLSDALTSRSVNIHGSPRYRRTRHGPRSLDLRPGRRSSPCP